MQNCAIRFSPQIEGIFSGTFGTGSVVYTNDTRYQLQDFKVGQYRAELNSKNWFLRFYTTQRKFREHTGCRSNCAVYQ